MDITATFATEPTPLCCLIEKYGSDKGYVTYTPETHHNYTLYYHNLFKGRRYEPLRIFELGIGTTNSEILCNMGTDGKPGASLRAWRDYFPLAQIYAADIDDKIMLDERRIKTYHCDQESSESIRNLWQNNIELWTGFDIIIDDGLHRLEANKTFFENTIHKLNVGGVFIIEDVGSYYLGHYGGLLTAWQLKYPNLEFRLIDYKELNHQTNIYDNVLIIAKRLY